jgi:hypothetical protein
MSTSEQPNEDAERGPEERQATQDGGETPDGAHEVPLFLRGRSDEPKGDAQDEKDGVGE